MDVFGDILQQDYGLKPTGKAAPMSAVKSSLPSVPPYSSASIHDSLSSSNSRRHKSANFGHASGVSLEEDLFFSSSNGVNSVPSSSTLFGSATFDSSGASTMYDDVFGGAPKLSPQLYPLGQQTPAHESYHDIFDMPAKSMPSAAVDSPIKSSSLPVFDAPLYDDDIFGGLPGIKNSNVIYDDVFGGMSSVGGGSSALEDLLGVSKSTDVKDRSSDTHVTTKSSSDYVELIPGFGGSEPASFRPANDGGNGPSNFDKGIHTKKSENSFETREDDPFIMLQSTGPSSTGTVEDAGVSPPTQFTGAYNRKVSNDESFRIIGDTSPHGSKAQSPPRKKIDATSPERQSLQINDGLFQPRRHHSVNSPARGSIKPSSSPRNHFENSSTHSRRNKVINDEAMAGSLKQPKDVGRRPVDEVWVSVEDVKLVTQPTAAPPPSRRPPPLPGSKVRMNQVDANLKEEDRTTNFSRTQKEDRRSRADALAADQDMLDRSAAASASARAMKEAMEKARSKLPGKDKEENGADGRASQRTSDDRHDYMDVNGTANNEDETGWQTESTFERDERESDEREKGGEKWRKDREKATGREWEGERERDHISVEKAAVSRATAEARERAAAEARQRAAVERATAEARERAAIEARDRAAAERAAVERANAEARERAAAEARERAAVERATAEARERAAAEARERVAVERATAEARERAAAEAREKAAAEARERAAVERATAEARERAAVEARERAAAEKSAAEAREKAAAEARERAAAERAAVDRATAEARERAAAEARERAAAERAAVERATAEARERAAAEARERAASEARARAERAAVERATAEARQRAAERAMAEVREKAEKAAAERNAAGREQRKNADDLESFFSSSSRTSSVPSQKSPPKSSKAPSNEGSQKNSNVVTVNKVTSSFGDDWTSLFGAASNAGEFQEVEGESEERRRARWERHQRTAERAAKALDEKNKRDLQTQREQAERHRVGEIVDCEIKRWAAGKEGNIRALLSTLQYVLWAECGWQPVSLTDLITAAAVKKVYRKATLCVHPDKVQQKGATIQQKYIAEKVFDLLKEAWNKFNSEELF